MESTITYVALVVVGVAYLGVAGALPWLAVRGRRLQLAPVEGPRRVVRNSDGTPRYGAENYPPGRAT